MQSDISIEITNFPKNQKLLLLMVHLLHLPAAILSQQYETTSKEIDETFPPFMKTLKQLLPYVKRIKKEGDSFLKLASDTYGKQLDTLLSKNQEMQKLLVLLSKNLLNTNDSYILSATLSIMVKYYNILPDKLQKQLRNISKFSDAYPREALGIALVLHYQQSPIELQELLEELLKDVDAIVREAIVSSIEKHFTNLPNNITQKVLEHIIKDPEIEIQSKAAFLIAAKIGFSVYRPIQ